MRRLARLELHRMQRGLRDVLLEVVKRFAIVASSNKCPDDATGLSNYLRIRSKTNRAAACLMMVGAAKYKVCCAFSRSALLGYPLKRWSRCWTLPKQ